MKTDAPENEDIRNSLAGLAREIEGEILTDKFSRGRYSTDASFYQIEPQGVAIPKTDGDLQTIIEFTRDEGIQVVARGGGTSQSGQTIGEGLVIDFSKYLRQILDIDVQGMSCIVEPGIVLDELNKMLAHAGLWFPVDVSTSSQATIGGMIGNNSCGTRSLRYGIMRDNVKSLEALLSNGVRVQFSEVAQSADRPNQSSYANSLIQELVELGINEAKQIETMFPDVSRRVGGYNLDALLPRAGPVNLAALLTGSEGTLAITRQATLMLTPRPVNRVLGICHFPNFRSAMESAQHIVKLGPVAVETVDRTMIDLARDIPMFRQTIDTFIKGRPEAVLLVEFSEIEQDENLRRLNALDELLGDLGHPGSVVKISDPASQTAIWNVRKSGLNIMMSMKSEGKPVSFIEDCAVPLEHLADYTENLTAVFEKYGTRGTWYAHASVGCLHVRPVLNLKQELDVRHMRAIAEEAFAFVRKFKGSHSGEHGDGLVRSEFHEKMFGPYAIQLFKSVKDRFDPPGLFNPGKIVQPSRMDDRNLFRYFPDYHVPEFETALDWSEFPGAGGGFQGAVEMCNNNGACRKFDANVMCPSYRVTRDEIHVTRGRANTLRLAISGQLGRDALAAPGIAETMKYCVSCKGCRRECPTGVDMAKMKIEVLHAMNKANGINIQDRVIGALPRYAALASKLFFLFNLRDQIPGLAWLSEKIFNLSASRELPKWRWRPFDEKLSLGPENGSEVVIFVDTFNRYFDPGIVYDAVFCLTQLGRRVHFLNSGSATRALCCGRTYLSVGMIDEARREAHRMLSELHPFVSRGVPIIGLEPSCLFTFRDEYPALMPEQDFQKLTSLTEMFEDYIARIIDQEDIIFESGTEPVKVLLHGHCHQKAFAAFDNVKKVLNRIPKMDLEVVTSSCCGMAGSFGYHAETYDISMQMAELSLLPALKDAEPDRIVVADGFSCRHQIKHGTGRKAVHTAELLAHIIRNSG